MLNLMEVLEEEAGIALNRLKHNQMIANQEKFHTLILRKDQTNTNEQNFYIQDKLIKPEKARYPARFHTKF